VVIEIPVEKPSISIICVNSVNMSYIPIAKVKDFTTYWIKKQILNIA